jgi:uncharacterized protein
MLGLVRVSTNAAIMGGQPLEVAEAWNVYLSWRKLPEVTQVNEPRACTIELHRLVSAGHVTQRTWTDAYLAAFAIAGGCRLVSFDRDFVRFPNVDLLLLE